MPRSVHAFIAASRFGLGARPGDLSALAHDPRGLARRADHGLTPASIADPLDAAVFPDSRDVPAIDGLFHA